MSNIDIEAPGADLAALMAAIANLSPIKVLAKNTVDHIHVGGATETILPGAGTVSLPANTMGLNDSLRITSLWTYTNSSNVKTARVRLAGLLGTAFAIQAPTTSATLRFVTWIANRNSLSSQIGHNSANNGVGSSASAIVTSAIDMSAAQDLVFTAQLDAAGAAATENITLREYLVELIRAP